MNKLIFTLLLSVVSVYAWTQEAQDHEQSAQEVMTLTPKDKSCKHKDHVDQRETTPAKPPNYGSLVIDWGGNFLDSFSPAMNINYLSSRLASGSFYYNIQLGHSHFTISPGIGITFNSYQFKNEDSILVYDRKSHNTVFKKASALFSPDTEIIQSALDIRYVDLMLQTRFNANSRHPKESVFAAIGGKLCLLWRASTKVKYKEDNETKTQRNIECLNLNRMRWGFYATLGWGRFGLCYTHIPVNLFQKHKGPSNTKTHSVALSVDLF